MPFDWIAPALWIAGALLFFALGLGAVRSGNVATRTGDIERARRPGLFWTVVAVYAAATLFCIVFALRKTLELGA